MGAEHVERQLEKTALTAREKCILALSFGGEITDETFHTLIDGLDLDTANQNYLLMLSRLGFTTGWKRFPPEMIPRLKGLHRFHQTHMSMGIPWLVSQIRTLTDKGIPVVLLKGVAMRAYYAPSRPRLMFDFDFAVPEEQFDRALALLLGNGNTLASKTSHSAALKGNRDEIDLHRWIFKMHNEQFSDVWERAETFRFHDVDVYVPAPEDMFIHLLDTQAFNHILVESPTRRIQWLYDCRDVWAHAGGLDVERLAERAREFHMLPRIRMMMMIFTQCFPELIKPEELERCFPWTPEYDEMLARYTKVNDAFCRYRGYGYSSKSAATPILIWRSLRVKWIRYNCLKPEIREMAPNMNYFRYIRLCYGLDEFSDLKYYFSKFRFFEKRTGGGKPL